MTETRRLAAILAADIAGYSRLASLDEERTLALPGPAWRPRRFRRPGFHIRIFAEFGMAPPLAEAFSKGARLLGLPE